MTRVPVAPCTAHDEPPGRLFAAYQGELGSAISERIRSRRLIRYEAPLLAGDAANALMRRADVQELAARVVRGYSHAWDGAGAERLVVFDAAAFFELDMDALKAKAQAHRWDAFDLVAYLRAKAGYR